jgi:hypothetical protein
MADAAAEVFNNLGLDITYKLRRIRGRLPLRSNGPETKPPLRIDPVVCTSWTHQAREYQLEGVANGPGGRPALKAVLVQGRL